MRIAFIVGAFPSISETFILTQIAGLHENKYDINIFAQKPTKIEKIHAIYNKFDLASKTRYFPSMPKNYIFRFLKMLYILAIHLPKKPRILIKSLHFIKYGRFCRSLRLFYMSIPFLEVCNAQYDVIHCHHGNSGMIGVLLREIGAIRGPLLTTFHGYDANVLPKKFGSDIYNFLFKKGNLFTVNSHFTGNVIKALGCPEHKIRKLPVGLNIEEYTIQKEVKRNHNKIKILTVGRLVEKKGVEYALKAISQIVSLHPNILYQIVGDGELRFFLEKLSVELNINNNVQFLGWKTQEELKKIYFDADIFMLVSVTAQDGDREGQGLVLQEAQASGLPVIATIHNGFPESVQSDKSAFLVPERDVYAITSRLEYLISNPHIRFNMGLTGRKYVENKFSTTVLQKKLISIYTEVVYKENEVLSTS